MVTEIWVVFIIGMLISTIIDQSKIRRELDELKEQVNEIRR